MQHQRTEIVLPEGTHLLGEYEPAGITYRIHGGEVQMEDHGIWSHSVSFHGNPGSPGLQEWVAAKVAEIAAQAVPQDRDLGECPINHAKYRVRNGVIEASVYDRAWAKSLTYYAGRRTTTAQEVSDWIDEQIKGPVPKPAAPVVAPQDANVSILRHAIKQALHSLKDATLTVDQAFQESRQILQDALEDVA